MSDIERISFGECISPRGVDHCTHCVYRCEAFMAKIQVRELSRLSMGIPPLPVWLSGRPVGEAPPTTLTDEAIAFYATPWVPAMREIYFCPHPTPTGEFSTLGDYMRSIPSETEFKH